TGGHGSLVLTPKSRGVLRGEVAVALRHDPAPSVAGPRTPGEARSRGAGRGRVSAELSGVELELFEGLRGWRKRTADEQGVPPYVIFHDATLRQIAEQRPRALAALARVSGVGATKLERYGPGVLAVMDEVLGAVEGAGAYAAG